LTIRATVRLSRKVVKVKAAAVYGMELVAYHTFMAVQSIMTIEAARFISDLSI
jgi:hypothetical protein